MNGNGNNGSDGILRFETNVPVEVALAYGAAPKHSKFSVLRPPAFRPFPHVPDHVLAPIGAPPGRICADGAGLAQAGLKGVASCVGFLREHKHDNRELSYSHMARKNAAAVALAKLRMKKMTPEERAEVARQGGLVGGTARATKLSAKERSAIARKAAMARWEKRRKEGGNDAR